MIRAVLFDVDFTLIRPLSTFRAEGYHAFCTKHGIDIDPSLFDEGVQSAAPLLDAPEESLYDAEMFVEYTRHIIAAMGGRGASVDACAREIYAEWASNHHFELYDDVPEALEALASADLRVGVISNSHRPLESFLSHFGLQHVISVAVSSAEHGRMKPHPSIFQTALQRLDVTPVNALMVGDHARQDVEGALRAGLHAVLLHRGSRPHPRAGELAVRQIPTIRSLHELPGLISRLQNHT